MTDHETKDLEAIIRDLREGWLIDLFSPPSEAMSHIRRRLAEANQYAQERYGNTAPELSEPAILEEYGRNPQRVRGILQILGASCTPEILVLVWRLIQGSTIQTIEVHYGRQSTFRMRVVLDGEDKPYTSEDINDFKVLRHVGIMKVGDAPVFDGFYPLRVG